MLWPMMQLKKFAHFEAHLFVETQGVIVGLCLLISAARHGRKGSRFAGLPFTQVAFTIGVMKHVQVSSLPLLEDAADQALALGNVMLFVDLG